jgi:hypothetical protein
VDQEPGCWDMRSTIRKSVSNASCIPEESLFVSAVDKLARW